MTVNLSSAAPYRSSLADVTPDPIFILSLPLSLGSVVSAMLGRHPDLYSLPETHLFLAENIGEWFDVCRGSSFDMAHGLLRAIAQLYYGEQTEETVFLARAWLRRRTTFTTAYVLEMLATKVSPRVLIEKSPSIVFNLSYMKRALRMFPQARFIHVVQHPRGHGEAVVSAVSHARQHGQGRVPEWLQHLACFSTVTSDEYSQEQFAIDPQIAWCELNKGISKFLEELPQDQHIRVRAEEILACSTETLNSLMGQLNLTVDEITLEEMKHPERSPYASFGPPGARYGDDTHFLAHPTLPDPSLTPLSLDGPVSWSHEQELSSATKELGHSFGYE